MNNNEKYIDQNNNLKNDKETKLLDTAFKLFTEKGIVKTSIQDIVDNAGVAKGTFYLYFNDKYELQEHLIIKKSYQLFHDALEKLYENYISNFGDQIIFIIDYIIDEFVKNPLLLKFISKRLSAGLYSNKISNLVNKNYIGLHKLFMKGIEENNIQLENPEVTLFMIIELVSSTCFSSVIKNEPLPIDEYKPYLYKTIKNMLCLE